MPSMLGCIASGVAPPLCSQARVWALSTPNTATASTLEHTHTCSPHPTAHHRTHPPPTSRAPPGARCWSTRCASSLTSSTRMPGRSWVASCRRGRAGGSGHRCAVLGTTAGAACLEIAGCLPSGRFAAVPAQSCPGAGPQHTSPCRLHLETMRCHLRAPSAGRQGRARGATHVF